MTTKSKQKPGRASVTATHSVPSLADKVSTNDFLLQATDVGPDPASVNYGVTVTHNLGNYESLRVSAGVTLPCRPTNVHQAGEVAKRIAHDLLDRSMTEWVGPKAGRRSPHYGEEEPEPANTPAESDPDFDD